MRVLRFGRVRRGGVMELYQMVQGAMRLPDRRVWIVWGFYMGSVSLAKDTNKEP